MFPYVPSNGSALARPIRPIANMRGKVRLCLLGLLVAISSSGAFLAPSLKATHDKETTRRVCMRAESSSSPSSRGTFVDQALSSVFALGFTILGATATPHEATAKDFAGLIDIKGIDTSEVLHPGAGGGGWTGKASKPLRDCIVNVERVRVSTKQVTQSVSQRVALPDIEHGQCGLNSVDLGCPRGHRPLSFLCFRLVIRCSSACWFDNGMKSA